ncbi:MAG TPA: exodeoxyribonuclease V subunit alpha [Kofleriaceae bacterium]|nr:exodeoxyribonuclease V subunit alpha [Kofleriaceae bacterium]
MSAPRRARGPALSPLGTALERVAPRAPAGESDMERWRRALRRLGQAATAYDLGDESVYLAEELVATAWSLGERQRLALALLALALSAAERQGSTRLPLDGGSGGPLAALVTGLCRAAGIEREARQVLRDIARLVDPSGTALLDSLIGGPDDGRPLVVHGGAIASHRLHRCEERLLQGLASRMAIRGADREGAREARAATPPGSSSMGVDAALDDVAARPAAPGGPPMLLTDEQRGAVALAASRPLAIVSGGPGTGKTAICAALCRVLVRQGTAPRAIALAAPTGKAAQRLTWSIAGSLAAVASPADADRRLAAELPEARTLHRLLGYQPASGRFRHHPQFPLPADVVIVDEASMIDLELMEHLVRALAPGARLVLFGDADQLPSVDAGAVLRDLAAGGEEAGIACRLARSFRMDPADPDGRAILAAAEAVRAGRAADLLAPELARAHPGELVHRGVERLDRAPDAAWLPHLVDAWYQARIAGGGRTAELARRTYRFTGGEPAEEAASDLKELAAVYERCRMLAATRRQAGGADSLNWLFHRRAAAELGAAHGDLLPGEPVVMRENDYARGLFNGDSGVVVRVQEGGHAAELRAVFAQPDGWLVFPLPALRARLERAYATTVHQSQGSEHDHVAVVLPAADMPLLSRELVYTALTRARRSVVLVGPPDVLRAGVERQVRRFSGIAAGLART